MRTALIILSSKTCWLFNKNFQGLSRKNLKMTAFKKGSEKSRKIESPQQRTIGKNSRSNNSQNVWTSMATTMNNLCKPSQQKKERKYIVVFITWTPATYRNRAKLKIIISGQMKKTTRFSKAWSCMAKTCWNYKSICPTEVKRRS